MLLVHQPEVEYLKDGNVKLKAAFEVNNVRKEMWYSTTPEFAPYLCHQRGDAFILPLLFYAMKRNLSVKMEVPISERLYYGITNYLERAMVHVFRDWHEVQLDCPVGSDPVENVGAVGTGLSCGIDSFATIAEHLSERQPKGHRLTHCTFFDVGGHSPLWTDAERTQKLFQDRTHRVRLCANELGLPLVVVDSNMEEILGRPFAPTHTFRTVSAVLALQKLFRYYYYSSGHSAYDFNFNPKDSSDYDVFSLPMVSTETLNYFSSGAFYTRIEKTDMVATIPLSYRYLNVCLYEDANCSICEKCLRTLLTLDILGKLHHYKNIFNLDLYRQNRAWFIGQVLSQRRVNPHYREIYEAMIRTDFDLGSEASFYLAWYGYRVKNKLKRVFRQEGSIQNV